MPLKPLVIEEIPAGLRVNFWKKRSFFVVFCPENVYLYAPKIVVSVLYGVDF